DLRELREALSLREAVRALVLGYGLEPAAVAPLPAEIDAPLSRAERRALRQLATGLERSTVELLRSTRPDRGYALSLAAARCLAARRSLSANRLVVLDAFQGSEVPEPVAEDVSDTVRAKWAAEAAELVRRGRESVLGEGRIEEDNLNLLEEAAAIAAREGRANAAGALSAYGLRKLPARARRVPPAAPLR